MLRLVIHLPSLRPQLLLISRLAQILRHHRSRVRLVILKRRDALGLLIALLMHGVSGGGGLAGLLCDHVGQVYMIERVS